MSVDDLPKSNSGMGYYIDYRTPSGLYYTLKIGHPSVVDLPNPPAQVRRLIAKWRKKVGKGYRVTDVFFASHTPSWRPPRPMTKEQLDRWHRAQDAKLVPRRKNTRAAKRRAATIKKKRRTSRRR